MYHDTSSAPSTSHDHCERLRQPDNNGDSALAVDMLRWENALLETLVQCVQDGILIVSPRGKMLYFNQQFVSIWKLPQSVLDSRSDEAALAWAAEQTASPEDFLARVATVYADQCQPPMRETLRMKDGRIFEHFGTAVRKEGVHYGWIWTFRETRKQTGK